MPHLRWPRSCTWLAPRSSTVEPTLRPQSVSVTVFADLDGDGIVAFSDFVVLLKTFGKPGRCVRRRSRRRRTGVVRGFPDARTALREDSGRFYYAHGLAH